MATYQKRFGKWRVAIFKRGVRKSATFDTKEQAQAWAARVEFSATHIPRKTLHDAFQRYVETVCIHHKGERWERTRIKAFARQLPDRLLTSLTSDSLSRWRDERLKTVSTGTARREMALLGAILQTAAREWGWIDVNPMRKVKRPPEGRPKDRVISDDEVAEFVAACTSPMQLLVAKAFLFALETGMRAGEIVGIREYKDGARFVTLPETKNGTARNVPLSRRARELLPALGFNLNSYQLDIHFRKVRDKLGKDYTFHATRHTAATRIALSGKLTPFELCAMFGWRDPRMAMRYVSSQASDIADRL